MSGHTLMINNLAKDDAFSFSKTKNSFLHFADPGGIDFRVADVPCYTSKLWNATRPGLLGVSSKAVLHENQPTYLFTDMVKLVAHRPPFSTPSISAMYSC